MKKVITYGSFDLFHEGHYNLLKNARALGDYLIVGVTTEQYDARRGKLNIVDPILTRVDHIRDTGFADLVIIEDHEGQKVDDIQKYGVDIFTVGSDWRGSFEYLKDYCEVVYLERTRDISSTLLRNETHGIVRMGIAGSGRIAARQVAEARFVSGLSVAGVYNPHAGSAEAFAHRYDLGFAATDYKDFLSRVAAVYVAAPHETHVEYVRRSLEAGKHVLCEKPLALRKEDARMLAALAAEKGVVLMEAMKTAFLPGFLNLLAIAKSGRLGQIRDVEATFTKLIDLEAPSREMTPGIGGSFTELASYSLLPIVKLLGDGYSNLWFERFDDGNGLDTYAKAHFTYPGALATAKVGLGVKSEGQLLISGTLGYILVQSPWWLTDRFTVCYENLEQNEQFYTPFVGDGLRYELAAFVRSINLPEENNRFKMSMKDSIFMAGVMERFLERRAT